MAGDDADDMILLLSGGMDSTALAALLRPRRTLFVNYGQRPAVAEGRAAAAVAHALGLSFDTVTIDLRPVGAGLLAQDPSGSSGEPMTVPMPSPEWWPFRNQLLVTVAAAWSLSRLSDTRQPIRVIATGTVASDAARHADGTAQFYDALDAVTRLQEGNLRVTAPAQHLTTAQLIVQSGLEPGVMAWCHSCHRSDYPCAECPGCYKRQAVLSELGY